MRRFLIALIIIAVLVTAGGWIYQNYFAKAEQPQQEREEVVARPGTLTAIVNTTGTILPEKQTALGFKSPGRVVKVLVEEGQTVRAGDVLAQLDTTDLEYAVAQAEIALAGLFPGVLPVDGFDDVETGVLQGERNHLTHRG